MFMSNEELKTIMSAYGFEDYSAVNHYEVGPDTWIYLFECKGKKYILVTTDYFGDYDFDVFPHLLKYESDRLEFVLQREIPVKDNSSREKTAGTLLFEYTD